MNKRTKVLIYVLLACIALAFVVFGLMGASLSTPKTSTAISETASTTATSTVTTTTRGTAIHTAKPSTKAVPVAPVTPAPSTLWKFAINSVEKNTTVTLRTENHEYDLGTFIGNCEVVPAEDIHDVTEISAVQCLTDGKGQEIGVFKQGTEYVVKKGDITLGDADHPSTRSVFVTIETVS